MSVDRIMRISAHSGISGTDIGAGVCELFGVGDTNVADFGLDAGEVSLCVGVGVIS
jgi:hypothetical protein